MGLFNSKLDDEIRRRKMLEEQLDKQIKERKKFNKIFFLSIFILIFYIFICMKNKSIFKLFILNNLCKVVFLTYAFMIDNEDRKFINNNNDGTSSSYLSGKFSLILVFLVLIISFLLDLIISFISFLTGTTIMPKIIFLIFFIGQLFVIIID